MTTWTYPATVVSVVDGDTAHLVIDLGMRCSFTSRVRLAGINAPELRTATGPAARDYLASLLPVGAQVTFVSHSLDKYGRPLGAVVLADGRDVSTLMLDAGQAVRYAG